MSALEKLVHRANEMDMTEQDQWLGDVFMASLAAKELARLQAVEKAAQAILNDIKNNWYVEKLEPGTVAETDVSANHMIALAAALERKA
jgi:hypothetical protein